MGRNMDNDHKIAAVAGSAAERGAAVSLGDCRREVRLFLKDELRPMEKTEAAASYNLEEEYRKTRANASPFIPLALLACFVVVALAATVATLQIRKNDSQISVSLDVFDDMNLKNLVDTVARAQDKYEQAVKNSSTLKGDLDARLKEAELKLSSDTFVVDSMSLGKKEAEERKKALRRKHDEDVMAIHAEYDAQISAAESEVAEYKAQLAEYDSAKVKSAQERDSALDSERRLQKLERQRLVDKYEKRVSSLESSLESANKSHLEDKKKAVREVADKYQREIDSLKAEIASLKDEIAALKEQVADLEGRNAALEKSLAESESRAASNESAADALMEAAGHQAVALGVSGGALRVLVSRAARPQITAEGSAASTSFTVDKKHFQITGTLSPKDGGHVFIPDPAEEGAQPPDLSKVATGTPIKITAK